jgi:CRP/FNR family transcriptional regulator, anaerobic regulatory protein
MSVAPISPIPSCGTPSFAVGVPHHNEGLAHRRSDIAACIPRGRALFWQDEHQSQNIEILQGVVRAVRLLENGNRQILAFFWPGDTIRPAQASCQHYTAEAVTPCWVSRSNAEGDLCSRQRSCGAHQVLEEMLSLIPMMGRKNSISCVAWFLLRVRPHLPRDPKRAHALQLLLPRADIADHLGTSIETVCRALAEFKARGLIELPTRKTIRFIDEKGLSQIEMG